MSPTQADSVVENTRAPRSCDRVSAIVVDWAGTVVDFGSCAPAFVFQEIFRQSGVPITAAQAREPMGMAKREHIATITRMPDVAARWRETHGRAANGDDVDHMYARFLPLQKSVLADHSQLIPGALATVNECRRRGIKIGSSTGYTAELMEVVVAAAQSQGFAPDTMVCSSDVDEGRPAPWMLLEAMRRLRAYPPASVVKVDDTMVGIHAGHHAGCWTVGVAATGNEMGLNAAEYAALSESDRQTRLQNIRHKFLSAGAHYVIDSIADLPRVVERIEARLAEQHRP